MLLSFEKNKTSFPINNIFFNILLNEPNNVNGNAGIEPDKKKPYLIFFLKKS